MDGWHTCLPVCIGIGVAAVAVVAVALAVAGVLSFADAPSITACYYSRYRLRSSAVGFSALLASCFGSALVC
jgi:hypothetical protein